MDDVDEAPPGESDARATPLDKAWRIIEYLELEAKDYITNMSEAERDTDGNVFALQLRRFGTGSSKMHIQQQFRTRDQNSEEDYMQYLDALEGLRSKGYPNEEVTVRRYEIMLRFIKGVRNFEQKTKSCAHACARTVRGGTTYSGRTPLHRPAISAHAWLLPLGQLSDGPSSATATSTI